MRCKTCHYSLDDAKYTCPKCGREFDRSDPSTFDPDSQPGLRFSWGRVIVLTVLSAIVLYLLLPLLWRGP